MDDILTVAGQLRERLVARSDETTTYDVGFMVDDVLASFEWVSLSGDVPTAITPFATRRVLVPVAQPDGSARLERRKVKTVASITEGLIRDDLDAAVTMVVQMLDEAFADFLEDQGLTSYQNPN